MENTQRKLKDPQDDGFRIARSALRLRRTMLPDAAVHQLAEEVVTQLVTRLQPSQRDAAALPRQPEVDAICDALLSDEPGAAAELIRRARRDGAAIETVYLGHLAEAARTLGRRWEDDRVSFLEMSMAASRIFGIMRDLRRVIVDDRSIKLLDRLALFATVPGEGHTIGITMAADLFRSRGWRIDLLTGLDHIALMNEARDTPYRLIGLSAGHPAMIPAMARLVVALRITHPEAHVVLSGQVVRIVPEVNHLVGADGVAADSDEALDLLNRLSDHHPDAALNG